MNAEALLISQGWRGRGHTLHATSDNNGLAHHLLIKRNDDGSGLGSKKDHKAEAWWMNAFDQALKGIDTSKGTPKQTLKGGALEKITARGAAKYTGTRGLYSSFVRAGVLQGTIGELGMLTPPESGAGTPASPSAEPVKDAKKETREERRARKEAKRLRKAAELAKEQAAAAKKAAKSKKADRHPGETKEERRARREARRLRKEEKRKRKATES